MVVTFSQETLTVPKAIILGIAEEVSEPLVDKINANSDFPTRLRRKKRMKLFTRSSCRISLSQEDIQILEKVLLKYSHIFHDEATNDFKGTSVIEDQIPVGNLQPIRRPPYCTLYALRDEMEAQIDDMLRKGVIRESNSPWSAPAVLVPKKSPDGKPKF
jgi:hypothetical protein